MRELRVYSGRAKEKERAVPLEAQLMTSVRAEGLNRMMMSMTGPPGCQQTVPATPLLTERAAVWRLYWYVQVSARLRRLAKLTYVRSAGWLTLLLFYYDRALV